MKQNNHHSIISDNNAIRQCTVKAQDIMDVCFSLMPSMKYKTS